MLRRSEYILLVTVILVMGAGVVIGRLSARMAVAPPRPDSQRSWLADQLNLTAAQRQQMDAIWDDTKQKMDKTFGHRHDLDKEREEAIHNLLSPEQRAAYDKIRDDFHGRRMELDKEREKLIRDAEGRSRALLDDGQKKQWDVLTKEMHEHHGPHGPGGPRPTTAP